MNPARRSAFSLIELLVVLAVISILLGILLPTMEHVRHQAYIDKCASNLRQIGLGISTYTSENQGNYPRTLYDPSQPLTAGTGFSAPDPFQPGGVSANDLTAPAYLLLRTQHLPAEIFICPYNDETSYFIDVADPQKHSNFTNWKMNLAYSFANPYPTQSVADAGYRLTNHLHSDFPVASDLNPGSKPPRADVTAATLTATSRIIEDANSLNHEQDGQNVLYADGHVDFQATPLCGIARDNIFTNQSNQVQATPLSSADAVLLPAN
jgi:prepilin-type N-terminal cleavage/methylation domain-containing protein/prepilin-type processing-associated H-X9-DG protein